MILNLKYKIKTATEYDISTHLLKCNDNFIPPLNNTVNITDYSKKLSENSTTFEVWNNKLLVGLIACYFNQENAFITNVSILQEYNGNGLASKLLSNCINYSRKKNIKEIKLEVNRLNLMAIRIYNKFGFTTFEQQEESLLMKVKL